MSKKYDLHFTEKIHQAVNSGHVYVDYQPIVDTVTGKTCALEALARWDDPDRGLMYPEQFIYSLEAARLIHVLDLFVLQSVCREMGRRKKAGEKIVPVNLNMSRIDFELMDMTEAIEREIIDNDLSPRAINIELTESVAQKDPDLIRLEVDRLREKGFEVWMDDFGSGYSSLSVLQYYDFNVIKIDMCFLQSFKKNDRAKIIIRSIIDMAREMGMKTLAEGVETEEQVSFLKESRCDMIQGFYYGRPWRAYGAYAN